MACLEQDIPLDFIDPVGVVLYRCAFFINAGVFYMIAIILVSDFDVFYSIPGGI
jgi:hypothetical protein